jgi:hypothetical protein
MRPRRPAPGQKTSHFSRTALDLGIDSIHQTNEAACASDGNIKINLSLLPSPIGAGRTVEKVIGPEIPHSFTEIEKSDSHLPLCRKVIAPLAAFSIVLRTSCNRPMSNLM